MPDDPVHSDVSALDGTACWHPVFDHHMFVKFVTKILSLPTDVVVS